MNQHLDRVNQCHPVIQRPVLLLVQLCLERLKRTLLITQGFRSRQDQMMIYQKGRAYDRDSNTWEVVDPTLVVTKAKPGLSAHNVLTVAGVPASMAVDIIPFREDGTPDWNVSKKFWDSLYVIAHEVGLDPLGDPIGSYLAGDNGHFEEPAWKLKLDGLGCYQPVTASVEV